MIKAFVDIFKFILGGMTYTNCHISPAHFFKCFTQSAHLILFFIFFRRQAGYAVYNIASVEPRSYYRIIRIHIVNITCEDKLHRLFCQLTFKRKVFSAIFPSYRSCVLVAFITDKVLAYTCQRMIKYGRVLNFIVFTIPVIVITILIKSRQSFKILNPLGEDTSIMRTTVLPSMLEILTRNYNYRNKNVKLYEVGRIYQPGSGDGLANEAKVLSMGAYGEDMDFFAMKGHIEAVLKDLRASDVHCEPCTDNPSYHPGRCATVWCGDSCIGVFGQIHPLAGRNYGVDGELYCAELSFDALMAAKGADPEYVALPKFPSVTRDIAVVCEEAVTVGQLEKAIVKGSKGLLKEVKLFDIYRGKGVDEGKKSVAFSLTMRSDDQTLTDDHAEETVKAVLAALEKDFGAVMR